LPKKEKEPNLKLPAGKKKEKGRRVPEKKKKGGGGKKALMLLDSREEGKREYSLSTEKKREIVRHGGKGRDLREMREVFPGKKKKRETSAKEKIN